MTNKNRSIGILGAGISGLSVAYALQKRGFTPTVYEKSEKVGGVIRTISKGKWLVEEGPNTLMVKSQKIWELLRELNLETEIVEANKKAKRRFVVKNDRPLALPSSLNDFFKTPLLSAKAKFRLLKEPFVSASESAGEPDESIASFIKRRLGQQPLDYGVNPFVSGVFAGDPKTLSVKHTFSTLWEMEKEHGSLFMGFIKNRKDRKSVKKALISFSKGIQTLPKAIAQALNVPVQTSCEIQSAQYKDKHWLVSGRQNRSAFEAQHDLLVSTLPAYKLSGIFESLNLGTLSGLPYAPLSVMALGFRDEQIAHPLDGFGMLIPEVEGYSSLGTLFSSTLFSDRVPKGYQLLTCFVGGASQPGQARKSRETLKDQLIEELGQVLGISGNPVFMHHQYWPKAIPQYETGYDQYLSIMKEVENRHKRLFIRGNYRFGVSVPDCILSGFATAQEVEEALFS